MPTADFTYIPKNIKHVFVGNILETYYRVYEGMSAKKRAYWFAYDMAEANRSILYKGDDKVVVTSMPVLPNHKNYLDRLMGWRNVHNLFPQQPSPSICEDIINQPKIKALFLEIIKKNPGVAIIPYRGTKEFYRLVKVIQKQKLKFTTPENLADDQNFIPDYCNTKRGFRHFWGVSVNNRGLPIAVPEGFIVGDLKEALEAAWWFFLQKRSFVIKHNRGTQGIGMKIFNSPNLPKNKKDFKTKLQTSLGDKMWREPPLVVEEYILQDPQILGGSPSVEFFIDEAKNVFPTYACEQLLETDRKTFKGCFIYPALNQHPFIKTAFKAGVFYGRELARLGYRGVFDMDLVVGKNGRLYAVETNLRRTGGTHIHEAAKNLLGTDYLKNYFVISEDSRLQNKRFDYCFLKSALKDCLFNHKTKTGFIFGNPDMLKVNVFHAFYLAPNLEKLKKLHRQTLEIINSL